MNHFEKSEKIAKKAILLANLVFILAILAIIVLSFGVHAVTSQSKACSSGSANVSTGRN